MGLLRRLVFGRPEGLRASLKRRFWAGQDRGRAGPGPARARGDPKAASEAGVAPERGAPAGEGIWKTSLRDVDVPPGQVREAWVGGRAVAVANLEGELHAVSGLCAHAGGPLGEGTLAGSGLTCPSHGWTFDLRDGRCQVDPARSVERYRVVVRDGWIFVQLGEDLP